MSTTGPLSFGRPTGTWLISWTPEYEAFWEASGKKSAWRTLIITPANLTLAFIVWVVVSALVVRLPGVSSGTWACGTRLWRGIRPSRATSCA